MVVDGKGKGGVRVSVSLDDYMWRLFVASLGDESKARASIRSAIREGLVAKSADARLLVLRKIARPSLVSKVDDL
ncbi:hypothetical protein HBA55_37035 [Pseudomaricurvus alkylphenolicus]|uniref:hypothetical protein n=1 Tax=Pseudomaricurvus alkylphenolicus TaxID=1306991 RepID=UPI0014246E43|nr:hypothetical protein [Pseudomaricurvus alkylphenolicus]NIB45236.1 hypothetical protein [Pseudomaricurvus alkylphenolicus]